MSIRSIINRRRDEVPAGHDVGGHLFSLQRDMNRLFDEFFGGYDPAPLAVFEKGTLGAFSPKVNVSETEKEVQVSAELPGLDEKDVNVELDENTLTIKGEKKEEHEEKGKNWHRIEMSSGSFYRVIPLPAEVDASKTAATFKKGVLTVSLPKAEPAKTTKKTVEVKAG